jgi:hypothetical protein
VILLPCGLYRSTPQQSTSERRSRGFFSCCQIAKNEQLYL